MTAKRKSSNRASLRCGEAPLEPPLSFFTERAYGSAGKVSLAC